jgi:hypothetical protein
MNNENAIGSVVKLIELPRVPRQNKELVWNEQHTDRSCNMSQGGGSAVAEFWRGTTRHPLRKAQLGMIVSSEEKR